MKSSQIEDEKEYRVDQSKWRESKLEKGETYYGKIINGKKEGFANIKASDNSIRRAYFFDDEKVKDNLPIHSVSDLKFTNLSEITLTDGL